MSREHGPFDRILRPNRTEGGDDGAPQAPDRAAIYVGGTIIGLAILLLVLILPPISILSDGSGGDASADGSAPRVADTYRATPRGGVPRLPQGLVAASALFDLSAPEDGRGPSGLTVELKEKQTDASNLALYTHADNRWQRLGDVQLVAGGGAAQADVSSLPGNVIVLRRSKAALQVAGYMPAGATLDERAGPVLTMLHPIVFIPGDDGAVVGQPPAVPLAGYKVVPAIVAPNPEVVNNILRSGELRQRHAAAIADAVKQGNFAGIALDYRAVNDTLKDQFAEFAALLGNALREDGRTLVLTLPMPQQDGGDIDTGAYDWERLGAAADTIEIAGELDQELYFQRTEAALQYAVERVERAKLLLTVSSQSVERGGDGLRAMSLDEALALASIVGVKSQGAITPGLAVPLVAQNLATSEGASGLRWDDASRAVSFSYPGRGGKRTVWIANQFSAAFRLELAQRYGIAGVVMTDASQAAGGGDVWTAVQQLVDNGNVQLSRPNGDLFAPTWSASAGAIVPTIGDAATWTAPAQTGPYEITLIVSDGVVRAGQRVTLEVVPASAPTP